MPELTAEQKELRRTGIGSSDIAAIAGLLPWRSAIDVWLQKTGRADDVHETEAMRMGHRLEPLIAELYEEAAGDIIRLVPGATCFRADAPWQLATPDYVAELVPGGERLVEIKTVGARTAAHWDDDDVPDYVVAQVTWQAQVTGLRDLAVAALISGQRFVSRRIEYLEDLAEGLEEIAHEFWHQNVIADTPPEVDASISYRQYVAKKWPRDTRPLKDAPPAAERWVAAWITATGRITEAEELKRKAQTALCDLIGDAQGIRGHRYTATWKLTRSAGTDWQALAMELGATPEQIARHARPGHRRFTLKEDR